MRNGRSPQVQVGMTLQEAAKSVARGSQHRQNVRILFPGQAVCQCRRGKRARNVVYDAVGEAFGCAVAACARATPLAAPCSCRASVAASPTRTSRLTRSRADGHKVTFFLQGRAAPRAAAFESP